MRVLVPTLVLCWFAAIGAVAASGHQEVAVWIYAAPFLALLVVIVYAVGDSYARGKID